MSTPRRDMAVGRLNPFLFPSDTTFRFMLLVVLVLLASVAVSVSLMFRWHPGPPELWLGTQTCALTGMEAANSSESISDIGQAMPDLVDKCFSPFISFLFYY